MHRPQINAITEQIIGGAIDVHRALGPGLLESAYQKCLEYELKERGLTVEGQVPLALTYRTLRLEYAYRLDLVVERSIVVEVKAIDQVLPVHEAQLLSYLRLSGHPVGLLINFHAATLKSGIRRFVGTPTSNNASVLSPSSSVPSVVKGRLP